MGKCCDFMISYIWPCALPEERRFKMSNRNRYYGWWLVLVAIFLSIGLGIGLGRYQTKTVEPVQGRTYYADWFTNDFCSYVNLTTGWPLRIYAYLFNKNSSSRSFCENSLITKTVAGPVSSTIASRDIFVVTLSLSEGDRISGQICMSKFEKVYIFTRRIDFLDCIFSDSWTECGLRGPTRYRVESSCSDYDNFDNPYILPPQFIKSSGTYYFVFFNSSPTETFFSARITKSFISSDMKMVSERNCQDETICALDLGEVSGSKAVCFEVLRYTPFADGEDEKIVRISCRPRLWMYFVLFFVIPIILGVIGTTIICIKCKFGGTAECCDAPTSQQDNFGNQHSRQQPLNTSRRDQYMLGDMRAGHDGSGDGSDTHIRENIDTRNEWVDMSSRSRETNNTDEPPSYDEVMKGTKVYDYGRI